MDFDIYFNQRAPLARHNAIRNFLAVTDRSKEALGVLVQFLVCCAVVSYFTAHFITYIVTDHYKSEPIQVVNHQIIGLRK